MRIAIICDFIEENWPSMDLVGDMLIQHLQMYHGQEFDVTQLRPPMRPRFGRLFPGFSRLAHDADRIINRFWDYPRYLRKRRGEFDLFHVVDHSYGSLVHVLPPDRTVITCHDLNTFHCLLDPTGHRRSWVHRAVARRVLDGFRQASRVACDSAATRDELLAYRLVPPERAVVVHNGVHPSCSPEPDHIADQEVTGLLGRAHPETIDLLHVSSTVPRKRIDILLRVFASVRNKFPRARLIRVGGPFTAGQSALVEHLCLRDAVLVLPFLDRKALAAVYRRAAIVVHPSDYEGFGLPVIEALACGTPVVASDLPVFREVGGSAATYCPVADVPAWSKNVFELLCERRERPDQWSARRAAGIAQAAKFSWPEYASRMVGLYKELLGIPV